LWFWVLFLKIKASINGKVNCKNYEELPMT